MDNDKQVVTSLEQSRNFFLDQPLQDDTLTGNLYEIEREFKKTRKNGSPFVWILSLIFLIILAGAALIVTSLIEEASRKTSVIVDQFEEIKLKEILDTAKKYQGLLVSAKRDLEDLQATQARLLKESEQTTLRDLALMEQQTASSGQTAARRNIRNAQSRRDQEINTEYLALIQQKKLEVEARQKDVDEYDTRVSDIEKRNQDILNNQALVFDREKQALNEYWENRLKTEIDALSREAKAEKTNNDRVMNQMRANHRNELARTVLRYNPEAIDESVVPLVAAPKALRLTPGSIPPTLIRDGGLTQGQQESQTNQWAGTTLLMSQLLKIPYINSVPGLLGGLEANLAKILSLQDVLLSNTGSLVKTLDLKIKEYQGTIKIQEKLINSYRYSMNSWNLSTRENGYILDSREPQNLMLVIQPLYAPKPGQKALVFRGDDEGLANIEITQVGTEVYAKVIQWITADHHLQAFDRILLTIETAAEVPSSLTIVQPESEAEPETDTNIEEQP